MLKLKVLKLKVVILRVLVVRVLRRLVTSDLSITGWSPHDWLLSSGWR